MSLGQEVALQPIDSVRPEAGFDYDSLSPAVAKFLKMQAERIRRHAATSAIRIGQDLISAKHYLSHGVFIDWVEQEVGIAARTAQAYMQVARWSWAKNATIAGLPLSLLYVLSAPGTPENFVSGILERILAGEPISPRAVREELREFRSFNGNGIAGHLMANDVADDDEKKRTLEHAVAILARSLSRSDFMKVRAIMTDESVLDDPGLASRLKEAFHSGPAEED